MSLYHALKCSDIVKRRGFESFGRVVDHGAAILFTYVGNNTTHTRRLSLTDLMAADWMVGDGK